MSDDLIEKLKAEIDAQRHLIAALREAGDGLWYCLRHKNLVSKEEVQDYVEEWTETRNQ